MRPRELDTPFKLPGSDSPLKKSTSVTAIIHGNDVKPTNVYYVDSLERFRRDYASVDKQERDAQRQREEDILARKRAVALERNQNTKQREEGNFQKLRDRQSYSLYLHEQGAKMTIHSYGTPVDPVNLRYQNSEKGRQLARSESEKHVNTLVRAHKLQTMGSSGYNIINGQQNLTVEEMVPSDNMGLFQNKLSNYYGKFRIRPQNI